MTAAEQGSGSHQVPADPEILANDALMMTAALLLAGTAGYEYYQHKHGAGDAQVALLATGGEEASEKKFLGMTAAILLAGTS